MKEWYCLFRGRKEGPFSIEELKRHPRFTPDTLVWKKGFPSWIKASLVRELEILFKDEKRSSKKQVKEREGVREAEILAARSNPPPFMFFLIIVIVVMFFAFYLFYL